MSPEAPKRDLTFKGIAADLVKHPNYRIALLTGDGKERSWYNEDTLLFLLLYGAAKVIFDYGPAREWRVNCTIEQAREILWLVRTNQQRVVSADNLAVAPVGQVRLTGPTRLRHHADKFPLVADLAVYGANRLRLLANVGNTTVRDAERFCERHGLKLKP